MTEGALEGEIYSYLFLCLAGCRLQGDSGSRLLSPLVVCCNSWSCFLVPRSFFINLKIFAIALRMSAIESVRKSTFSLFCNK